MNGPLPTGDSPRRRVILLGASNLTRGLATVVAAAGRTWDQPLQILAAAGRGRSFGRPSRLFARELVGIVECGLWPALAALPAAPCAALVTDIGNDLMYEQSVESIIAWVEICLERLAWAGARTIVTQLPIANLNGLSARRFRLLRKIFFPRCRLELDEVIGSARELNRRLVTLAENHGATVAEQQREWFGLDPIHITRGAQAGAWRDLLATWNERSAPLPAMPVTAWRRLYFCSLFPENLQFFGFQQHRRQPAGKLRDGTTVALY